MIELLISTADTDGPNARAKLAVDCVTPKAIPRCSGEILYDASLVSAGVGRELPIEKTPPPSSNAPSPPAAGPTNGTENKLNAKLNPPIITGGISPKRFPSHPTKPPWIIP